MFSLEALGSLELTDLWRMRKFREYQFLNAPYLAKSSYDSLVDHNKSVASITDHMNQTSRPSLL